MTNEAPANSLTVRVERKGDVAMVHCSGRLVTGLCHFLIDKVTPLIHEHKRVVLDLTELTHMDSMGLGTLVRLYCSAKAAGCRFQLINLGKQIRDLLGVTNLLSTLTEICEQGVTLKF